MSTDTAKLGARLRGARQRRFVGRASELELFRQALEEPEAPWAVLWLHGPGGVGKTALLHVLVETAEGAGVPAWRLDLRGADATPPGFTAALTATLGVDDGDAAMSVLGAPGRRMLLLDTFEVARGLDAWLRERFLPELGTGTAVVVAGRDPPGPGWLEDPGWRELLRVVSLRNLPPDDARALLRSQDVAEPLHDRVLAATHGHPLALWLLVEVLAQHRAEGDAVSPALGDSPDVVRVLIERFVAGVPSASHREAVEVCAHARTTTESLLRASVDGGDPAALFAWLRALSFVEEGPEGVFPHDVARDVIDADLRWRDPARYETVHRRVRAHVMTRVQGSRGRRQQRAVTDLLHLHGANPSLRRFYDWDSLGRAYPDALRPTDHAAVLEMAERHEGPESAALVAFWLERQPEGFVVARTPDRDTPRGFLAIVALHEASDAERAADPGAQAMWAYALAHGAPAADEQVCAMRFMVDADAYQAPSASFNVASTFSVQHYLTRSRLSWDFIGVWADPGPIAPFMAHIDYARVPEADYEVAGRRYGVYAHDWRRVGVEEWLHLTGDGELADGVRPPPAAAPPVLALSEADFAHAVRRALRDLHRPAALAASPLTAARVVRDREEDSTAAALAALLREAAASLQEDPRDAKLHRALDRTYLHPAPTHEAAAEVLGLPFSTYRGHLTRATDRVVEWLWRREVYGPRGC